MFPTLENDHSQDEQIFHLHAQQQEHADRITALEVTTTSQQNSEGMCLYDDGSRYLSIINKWTLDGWRLAWSESDDRFYK